MLNACERSSQNGDQNHLGEKGITEGKGCPSLITATAPGMKKSYSEYQHLEYQLAMHSADNLKNTWETT
jgi:hypothetical protein